jgi:hypothetical protein
VPEYVTSSPRFAPWLIPGHDEVGHPVAADEAQGGQPHAVDRRAVRGEAVRAVVEVDPLDDERAARGDPAPDRRAVAVRGDRDEVDPRPRRAATRRSACSPSASMPSSFVSSTRIAMSYPS